MKRQILILTIFLTSTISIYSQVLQERFDIRDFYTVDYTNYNNELKVWLRPDSLKDNPNYVKFGAEMYNFLDFLREHYSSLNYEYEEYLNSFLPDKKQIEDEFENKLVNDTSLNKYFIATISKKYIGTVGVDTIQKILARFFFISRYTSGKFKGELDLHVCLTTNDIFSLPQNGNSPYLNAFCWTIVRTNMDLMKTVFNKITMPNQIDKNVSESKLNEYQIDNYKKIMQDNEIRQIIITEYKKRKEFLNFELIY